MEELKFSLKREQVRVVLEGEDGKDKVYFLKELTGKGRDEYLSHLSKKMRFNNEGKPSGLKSFDGLQTKLLTICLYDEDGKLAKADTIGAWPSVVVDNLFKKAQDISALNDQGVDDVGNESEASD